MKKFRSSRPEVLCKKGVLQNFAEFTGKHLLLSLFVTVIGLKCFCVNFAKFLRTLCKTFVNTCFWKSCSFWFSFTITDTIYWNNFLTNHRLILLYYFHREILKEKTTIFFKMELLWPGLFSSIRKQDLIFFLPVILGIISI